jgi:ATP-binding cassette subfamily C protein CydD
MIDRSLLTLRGVKRIFAILLVMAILQGLFTIAQAVSLATVITNLFNGEKLSSQLSPILFFVLIYISKHFMLFVRNRMMNVFAIKSGKSLRQQLNKKLFEVGPNITAKEGTGNVVTMALEGISQVEHYIQIFLPKIFNMLVIPALIFFYTLSLDIRSAIVLIVVLPTLLFFLIILGKAAKFRADKQYKTYQLLSNHFVDSLRGLETLRLLGLSKNYDRNIEQVSERYRKSTMGTLAIAFLSSFSLQFFTSLSVAIIALFLGLGLIDGEMALYPALVILILAPEYFGPIRDFGSDYHATLDGKNALTQIHQVIESPTLKKDNTAIESWNENSILTLSNVTVQYEEALKPSMNEVSFSWKGYGKIGEKRMTKRQSLTYPSLIFDSAH